MTWLDRVIKLGDRLADLTERGVVALEKLAGGGVPTCKHSWIPGPEVDTCVCDLCGETQP